MSLSLEPGSITPKVLKAWRKSQLLSQTELAMLLRVNYTTVANWESGRRGIPGHLPLALEAISRARESQVRKLRIAKEELAHKRRMKMIEQGLRDKPKARKVKPGEQPKRGRGNPNWIRAGAERRARLAREAAS